MVTRVVPRYAGTQATAGSVDQQPDQPSQQSLPVAPEEILRRAHATSIAGVIGQIAQVAAHALDIFTELRIDSDRLTGRLSGLVDRVDTLAAVVLDGDVSSKQRLPTEETSDRVLHVPELSFMAPPNTMAKPTQAAYDRCEPLPPFEVLAEFCPDISQYRKKYSNPEFFKEDWMQRETFRQQHEQEQRDERRRQRKEQRKSLAAGAGAGTGSNQNEDANAQAVLAETESGPKARERVDVQQKMTFLSIRSWKERYGTGEGKELLKPPTAHNKQLPPALVSLQDQKKKRRSLTRKSLSIVREHEDDGTVNSGEMQPGSPAPNSPAKEESSEFNATGSVSKKSETPVFSGAFMQEIEDPGDDLEHECSSQQATSPVYGGVATITDGFVEPVLFVDQGLSYYDPHEPGISPPPPPPAPPHALIREVNDYEEEDSWTTGQPPPPPLLPTEHASYLQDYDEVDDDPPPPPPPEPTASAEFPSTLCRGSFGLPPPPPPPPPPPLPAEQWQQRQVPVHVRMPSLLQELQSKRSELRHVDEEDESPPPPPPLPGGLLSPRMNLLQQIRAQQLRPVGPPRGRLLASSLSTPRISAPFASSIARILERRNLTAYDSDTSDKSDGCDSSGSEDWN